MKTKTFIAWDCESIDKLANEFEATHKVKFAQTHVAVVGQERTLIHSIVLFFED